MPTHLEKGTEAFARVLRKAIKGKGAVDMTEAVTELIETLHQDSLKHGKCSIGVSVVCLKDWRRPPKGYKHVLDVTRE